MGNRSKTLAASLLAATFLLGIAVGGVAMAAWGDDDDGRRTRRSREHVSYAERLTERLDLSAAQQESVAVILERRQEVMHQVWQDVHPKLDSLRLQIRDEILAVLDEEQQTAYADLIARSDSVREHRRLHGERR
jgi:uncharacterized membrane protein